MGRPMTSTVFISHAGADAKRAADVAGILTQSDIQTRFDRADLTLGDSFLTFMNEALNTSDYCLLLWSQQASATPWVELEWEAALYRSVREKRSFLVIGRLEEVDVPALLAPRLRIDLFPALDPGMSTLVNTWRADRAAESDSGKSVGAPWAENLPALEGAATVYIDSEEFGMTAPMGVKLEEPAGAFLDRVVTSFGLPRELSYAGKLGTRFSYRLFDKDSMLERTRSLAEQGITSGRVLTLETTATPFSTSAPVRGQLSPTVFRSGPSADQNAVLADAMKDYRAAVARAGLGPVK
jgi:TIR domain